MNFVIGFDQPQGELISLVGGKGSNLIALTTAGFPVPPGFVVTAEAYRLFIEAVPELDESLAAFNYGDHEQLSRQCGALRAQLEAIRLPPTVEAAIRDELGRLDTQADHRFAVRSSSTLEDLAQAAFAGQHDTYLNVSGTDAILTKVRDCFVSLWGDRAVLYRHHQGFQQREARMAAVVQQQIACDRAGVGFSMNPVSGQLNRLVLNANYGIGESVVSGECEIDQFELDKETLQVIERNIGHKDRMVAPTATGVEEQPVSDELADRPCLTDEQIRTVAELLNRVAAHYGWPQDIEWGFKSGQLHLFQSRAVTTIQPRYTRDESAERFPNPMTPLSWDFLGAVFRRSLTHSLALMGLPPLKDDWFSWHEGYIYGNQNAVELLTSYRPLRARSPQELVAEIPDLRRRFAWVSELPVHWARDLDRYLISLGRLSAKPLDSLSVPEMWRHVVEIQETVADYFRPNIAISITQSFLHRLLYALVKMVVAGDRALAVLDGLMAGCDTKTTAVNRELHELAQFAAQHSRLKQALVQQSGREFWDQGQLRDHPEFARLFERFIENHGHREMDIDYCQPTWSGQPWVVLDSIALILRKDSSEDPTATARALRLQHAQTELGFLSAVPEDLRFFFRELVRLARTYTSLDDLEHYQTTRAHPEARRAALALGERFVEASILDAPDDVFFFQRDDLQSLAEDFPPSDPAAYRERVYQAKRAHEAACATTPPWSLDDLDSAAADATGNALSGLPGSPGKITAPCFLVHGPDDFARFRENSVLVARTTNPAWTPLFYSAAGLITESGGPLSHGAVTAREMQLPAVMSVRGVMSLLENGQVVTVDGTQGKVFIETP